MFKGDEWTGLIKVHQVLEMTGCLSEDQYTILKLNCLLTVNQLIDLSKLMQSVVTPDLLLTASENNQLLIKKKRQSEHTLAQTK
jgi:hypothetical protein